MPRRIHLHVGAPKSGTTYLQSRLLANQRQLRRHGLTYPLGRLRDPRIHYWGALSVVGKDHGLDPESLRDAWPRLLRACRRAAGDVVLGHEILSSATAEQARRVLDDLHGTGAEVHVVMTARDLSRELTSGWQEMVKFGSVMPFGTYMRRARRGRLEFMRSFDVQGVLTTWGADLPADRLHLVTAPGPGGARGDLWSRFLEAVGAEPGWGPLEATRANESLGVPEVKLLRRLNSRLGDETRRGGTYAPLLETVVVPEGLAPRRSPRITVGPQDHPWVVERSESWMRWARQRGVRIHGDLADLHPAEPPADRVDPDAPLPGQVTAAAIEAMVALLAETRSRRPAVSERARRAVGRLRG
ncbi:hypothetical protein [Isoptericola aurantiacus]|uniref:hypothetical protein n=1 Tax=Isoptericola aurantiacus TaxID=3377839 RepID=UPI00383B9C2F